MTAMQRGSTNGGNKLQYWRERNSTQVSTKTIKSKVKGANNWAQKGPQALYLYQLHVLLTHAYA